MKNHNAVFLVGGPGSGKDFVLRTALKESGAIEIPLAKLATRIREQSEYPEIDGSPIIVSGNSDQGPDVELSQAVLEAMGYKTAMIFVYTTDETSQSRSIIPEGKRYQKYEMSIKNMHAYSEMFGEGFFLFDNSADFLTVNEDTKSQMVKWIAELRSLIEGYFEKPVLGIRAPKVPKPVGGAPAGGHHVPAGYERVKQGSFNVLRKKKPEPVANQGDTVSDETGVHESVDVLFEREFPTIVDMIAQKKVKGQSQGDKYKGGIAVPGAKATSKEVVEAANKHVIVFSHDSKYRVHKVGCPAAKEGKHRTLIHHEGDAQSALQWCHDDESEKAGKPTKAHAAICKCAKPVSESNQEIKVQQTQVKGVKYSKNRPAKGAKPPGDTFDSRMGAVPSGGIGLTAYKEEVEPKTLDQIRKK